MLPTSRARQLLGPGSQLTDEQLERELARMYEVARTLVPNYQALRRVARPPIPETVEPGRFSVVDQEAFDERARIMEFDEGPKRSEAESGAREIVFGPKTGDSK